VADIRLASDADAGPIAAIYAPYCEKTAVSFETSAPSPAEMADRIRKLVRTHAWLVLEDAGHLAGYAFASPHRQRAAYRWAVDMTVYVAADYRRAGVGRALYTALLPVLALQGYCKAYAGVSLPNPASVGLHEAVGFTLVGVYRGVGYKIGAWHDVAWYQRSLQPEPAKPAEPILVDALRGSAAWTEAIAAGLAFYRGKV
jgi:phosphinothricin acetyltransferase